MTDALSGLGYACGHNLIAVSSMAAALATVHVVLEKKLGGKVVLFGTPAEGKFFVVHRRGRRTFRYLRSRISGHGVRCDDLH